MPCSAAAHHGDRRVNTCGATDVGVVTHVARALRQDPRLAEIPIVAVTSYAMPGDRERCMEAGCNGYIEKPIDPGTFAAEVERFVRGAP